MLFEARRGEAVREKVNILLVDDQPAKLLTYETILSELGENLIRAGSGAEALEHLLKTEVAVLLVDVHMPGLDGFELARIIREHPRFQQTAIIFVSAIHLTDLDRLTGYRLGAVDYVPVPVIPEILRAKVGVFVELYRKTQQLERMNSELETRVAERTAALSASEERFRLATEAMRGGLYDGHVQTNTMWWSSGLAALLGYPAESPAPTFEWWQDRIHPDDLQTGWKELWADLRSGSAAFDAQYRVRRHDGSWLWVWDRGRIVRDRAGQAVRVVGHITDISAQKIAEDALKEADQRKDEFLATLSHELRNPLAPIRNALKALRTPGVPEAGLQKSLEIIERQVAHLTRLVDDLLDVSRISRNKFELRKSAMDLTTALSAAIEASAPLLEQSGLSLTVELPPPPIPVDGDLVRLTQAFTNLLNNSAKYTPRGGQVWLAAEIGPDCALVRVADTGHGIASDNLQRVFQMFYQGDIQPRSNEGFGIGLTLVAWIVEMHGGSIEARSEGPDTGSEFIVRLPVSRGSEKTSAEQKSGSPAGKDPAPALRVLVADDNEDSAESLGALLRLEGYEVQTVYDGLKAIEAASKFLPEVVLLDIGMPGMNGYEAARKIRALSWGKNILIIAQTGWGQEWDRWLSQEAGFDAHLTKPVDHDVLMRMLADYARKEQTAGTAR